MPYKEEWIPWIPYYYYYYYYYFCQMNIVGFSTSLIGYDKNLWYLGKIGFAHFVSRELTFSFPSKDYWISVFQNSDFPIVCWQLKSRLCRKMLTCRFFNEIAFRGLCLDESIYIYIYIWSKKDLKKKEEQRKEAFSLPVHWKKKKKAYFLDS
jgi:hypothetical protein